MTRSKCPVSSVGVVLQPLQQPQVRFQHEKRNGGHIKATQQSRNKATKKRKVDMFTS